MQTIQVGLTVPQSKPLIDVLRGVLENSKGRGEQRKGASERKPEHVQGQRYPPHSLPAPALWLVTGNGAPSSRGMHVFSWVGHKVHSGVSA